MSAVEYLATPEKTPHNCGIFGMYLREEMADAIPRSVIGLIALQHRGQEGAGAAITDAYGNVEMIKGSGLVKRVLTPEAIGSLKTQKPKMIVEQTRYSTSGGENAWQPYEEEGLVLVHNGNFTNPRDLLEQLPSSLQKKAESDSWIIHQSILQEFRKTRNMKEAIINVVEQCDGAYNLIISGEGKMFGIRDPKGFHPMVLGELPDGKGHVLASEPTALMKAGARYIRPINPGEGVVIDDDGVHTFFMDERTDLKNLSQCLFELIYFASPDSKIFGRYGTEVRRELGKSLARKDAAKGFLPDIIVPIEHSGRFAGEGYAQEMQTILLETPELFGLTDQEARKIVPTLQLQTALIVNADAIRSFIMPDGQRQDIISTKHRVDTHALAGKRVALIDDSIVKGPSAIGISQILSLYPLLMNDAPPAETHLRSSAAQIKFPCYMGVDFPDKKKLVAARLKGDNKAIAKELGFDSVDYPTPLEMLAAAVGDERIRGLSEKDAFKMAGFCGACFTGEYPIQINTRRLFSKTQN